MSLTDEEGRTVWWDGDGSDSGEVFVPEEEEEIEDFGGVDYRQEEDEDYRQEEDEDSVSVSLSTEEDEEEESPIEATPRPPPVTATVTVTATATAAPTASAISAPTATSAPTSNGIGGSKRYKCTHQQELLILQLDREFSIKHGVNKINGRYSSISKTINS